MNDFHFHIRRRTSPSDNFQTKPKETKQKQNKKTKQNKRKETVIDSHRYVRISVKVSYKQVAPSNQKVPRSVSTNLSDTRNED